MPEDLYLWEDIFVRSPIDSYVPPPTVAAVGDVMVHEGDAGARTDAFTVSLQQPVPSTVSVDFATVDGTAKAGEDYTARSGTLSFAPGTSALKVKVPLVPDTVDEPVEKFTVTLSGAVGAAIGDSTGLGSILDDEPPVASGRRLAIGDASVYEGNAGARTVVFNVNLSTPSSSTVTVRFGTVDGGATAASDYAAKNGTVTFSPGTTSVPVKVAINADGSREGHETFTVVLSELSGFKTFIADGTGVGTILEDD